MVAWTNYSFHMVQASQGELAAFDIFSACIQWTFWDFVENPKIYPLYHEGDTNMHIWTRQGIIMNVVFTIANVKWFAFSNPRFVTLLLWKCEYDDAHFRFVCICMYFNIQLQIFNESWTLASYIPCFYNVWK